MAATPASIETMRDWGWEPVVEPGAGVHAGITDEMYTAAGAALSADAITADLILQVGPPTPDLLDAASPGAVIAGFLDPFVDVELVEHLVAKSMTALAVEAIPRTTLAQSMDALSSQANLAGYAAVLVGSGAMPRILPMMVTAAGTIPPSRALILGVGVAGLQAIATAKRLGAAVHAYDIRTETREQVESLGAKFVAAPTTAADEGGYAQEVEQDTQKLQHEALAPFVADADLIVTTAQIPGRPAPLLITEEMVDAMRPGSVIVDMAAGTGGNVALSRPDEVVDHRGVKILGPTNLASSIPADASRLYARNLMALLERARSEEGGLALDLDDEIIGGTTVIRHGEVRHPRTQALLEATS